MLQLLLLLAALGTPCPFEDSENCLWNAAQRGNGIGQSFLAAGDRVIYLTAHAH